MDKEANERFYQRPGIPVNEILNKEPGTPKEARELQEELNKAVK